MWKPKRLFLSFLFFLFIWGNYSAAAQELQPLPSLVDVPNPYKNDWQIGKDQDGNYWAKGDLPEENLHSFTVFYIPSPRIFNYEFFLLVDGKLKPIKQNTNSTGLNIRSRYPIYSIRAENTPYYLKFADKLPQFTSYKVIEQIIYHEEEKIDLFQTGIYYGFLLLSLIIYSTLFYILEDKRVLFYTLLLLSVSISFIYEDGLFYFFSNGNLEMENFTSWIMGVTSVLCLPFTYYFLDMKFPLFKNNQAAFYYCTLLLLLLAFAHTLTGDRIYLYIIYISAIGFPGICIAWAVRRLKHDPLAKFFIVITFLLMVGGLLYSLNEQFSLSFLSFVELSSFRIFCAVIFTLIGIAIIYKIKLIQDRDELNRQELNAYLIRLEQASTHIIHNDNGLNNESITKRSISRSLKNQYKLNNLESEILYEIWQGLNNNEISEKLNLSITALKSHISNIYLKMDIRSQKESMDFKDFVLK